MEMNSKLDAIASIRTVDGAAETGIRDTVELWPAEKLLLQPRREAKVARLLRYFGSSLAKRALDNTSRTRTAGKPMETLAFLGLFCYPRPDGSLDGDSLQSVISVTAGG